MANSNYVPTFLGPLGPEDTDDFKLDFSSPLAGATISSIVEVVADPSTGLTITNPTIISGSGGADSAVGFTASAGTPTSPGTYPMQYTVSASVTTSDSRDLTRSAYIVVNFR